MSLAHEEATAPADPDGGLNPWIPGLTRFASLDNLEGFGWRSMRYHVGWEDG